MQDDKYPEILIELKEILSDVLFKTGVDKDVARDLTHKIAETVRHQWGGQLIYIPLGKEFVLNQRDKEIWDKFNGRNHRYLCREYRISLQRIYKIIAIQQQIDMKERQTSLIPDDWSSDNEGEKNE